MSLQVLNTEAHEAKCRRCGVSCHFSLEVGDKKYVINEIHCRFLARETDGKFSCTVYDKRFELAPWCHTATDAINFGALATGCLYTEDLPGYQGREWAPPNVKVKLLPRVRQKLIADGLPISANPDSALLVLNQHGERWTYSEQKDRFVFHREDPNA